MQKKVAVSLTNISKNYFLHHDKPTLVEKFINNQTEKFRALDNINLKIYQGQKVGIVGPNGSGKTTLLKVITGITCPTTGIVKTKGRVVSLIDLRAGFHPDLTGLQNIYLNGLLLGMKKSEISKRLTKIIKFAEIDGFIDTPLYTYSAGMILRLGFAVAVHANPDILILDESMGFGDIKFQKKSKSKLKEFFRKGKTIILVTHWLDFIRQTCQRVIVMEQGKIVHDGGTKILKLYERNNRSLKSTARISGT